MVAAIVTAAVPAWDNPAEARQVVEVVGPAREAEHRAEDSVLEEDRQPAVPQRLNRLAEGLGLNHRPRSHPPRNQQVPTEETRSLTSNKLEY